MSTSADIESDPHRRIALVEAWTELPDLVTANLGEDGIASWAVNLRGAARGHGIRTGLEDTPVLPDGRDAEGNGDLVAAAAAILERHAG